MNRVFAQAFVLYMTVNNFIWMQTEKENQAHDTDVHFFIIIHVVL